MNNSNFSIRSVVLALILFWIGGSIAFAQDSAFVKIIFQNRVKNDSIVLYDGTYTNPFGEKYTINKFRYYVSHVSLNNSTQNPSGSKPIYLIDEAREESRSFVISVPPGEYTFLHFQLGIDSIFNVSGAQAGALDPTKDMFWTWNTGYVMAKLEGNSPASNVVNQKYEFHIGGFAGRYNVLKQIQLSFPRKQAIRLVAGKTTEITVQADVNAWFQGPNDIKISDRPAINSPGKYALAVSDNYVNMFSIEKIEPAL